MSISYGVFRQLDSIALRSVLSITSWVCITVAVLLLRLTSLIPGLFVAVPVQTYCRHYVLFSLGDTEIGFNLIFECGKAVN